MFELILITLAEFGLIREDYKHRKGIRKKEKAEGIKRPFQKYLLQPSFLILIAVLLIGSLGAFLFFSYQRASIFPKKTKQEMAKMSNRLEKWHEEFGKYPTHLNELIGNSPIRQDWKKDAWNRDYQYSISNDGKGFIITSSGPDGKFETKDDITSE
ncbi:type II secretion system protein GspG [Zhouia amylolytica]|uniref:type II secretion system protein GspG n=1 Tax=Zhouia amylolytica TaxID=376730 RepID=UPI0020CBF6B1|nr:type II secretion system protein GspG [Zhouia amylolytica]MCQ0113047.1 type II secretion system protein GspG [Zhouia amylolytica]